MSLPILYSFRRCPYAMRARLGIMLSGESVDLREIILKHKPQAMLDASPKGTVPVLVLSDGSVIEESIEIMCWALAKSDPADLLLQRTPALQEGAKALIQTNDGSFKSWLDKYKYADRYPEMSEQYYRQQGEVFIAQLESLLNKNQHLLTDSPSIADYAIYPFVRQFAGGDKTWFENADYPNVQRWLTTHLHSSEFKTIMKKYPTWLESNQSFKFGNRYST